MRFFVAVYNSDETGLMLGTERLSYSELRRAIDRIPAGVRVVILDSCASGSLLRMKGGRLRAPFLIDQSSAVKGHAFLTAASENEAAQESDRIRASFFTAALVTGLRGAADSSHDGKVTLQEAYTYAFNETLARTTQTLAGAQHPAFDIQLSGTGDLVMTDLRKTRAKLVLAAPIDGTVFIQRQNGEIVAELHKVAGTPIELGLEPGRYSIVMNRAGTLRRGWVALADGRTVVVELAALSMAPGEAATVRGSGPVSNADSDNKRLFGLHRRVTAMASETLAPELALKLRGEHFYGFAGAGVVSSLVLGHSPPSGIPWMLGLGIGCHFPREQTFLDVDLGFYRYLNNLRDSSVSWARLRAVVGTSFGGYDVVAGPTLNFMLDLDRSDRILELNPWTRRVHTEARWGWQLYPGLTAGIQF